MTFSVIEALRVKLMDGSLLLVQHVVHLSGGSVELVDVSDQLQGLKYSKGTYSWKVRLYCIFLRNLHVGKSYR